MSKDGYNGYTLKLCLVLYKTIIFLATLSITSWTLLWSIHNWTFPNSHVIKPIIYTWDYFWIIN